MQSPQAHHLASNASDTPGEQPKATWHRPTITFVPLQTTAFDAGSPNDGTSGSFNDALDNSVLK